MSMRLEGPSLNVRPTLVPNRIRHLAARFEVRPHGLSYQTVMASVLGGLHIQDMRPDQMGVEVEVES